MAQPIGCTVNEDNSCLVYKRTAPDIKDCSKKDFCFNIESQESQEVGILRVKKGEEVLREHMSKPFAPGSFKKLSLDVDKTFCKVNLKKASKDTKLEDYFG